jgi:hypothetical protein
MDQQGEEKNPITIPVAIAAYKQFLIYVFFSAMIFIAILLLVFFATGQTPSLVIVVCLCGALGAIFSSLIRVYQFEELPIALVRREMRSIRNFYLLIYASVPLVIGAIAATAIYVGFASEIITASVFPKFSCKPVDQCTNFTGLIENWGPSTAQDYAKALLWAFICGFSERFAPNALNRIMQKAEGEKK